MIKRMFVFPVHGIKEISQCILSVPNHFDKWKKQVGWNLGPHASLQNHDTQ